MQSDWAAESLKTIRTLMERSAVYRRALAPLMGLLGVTGIAASVIGNFIPLDSPRAFVGYWMAISVLGLVGAFFLIRQQAVKANEPYWTLPARRVVQAILPALFTGAMAGVPFLIFPAARLPSVGLLVPVWIVLYGCAMHAAGFAMPRGIKLFGWGFIAGGTAVGFAWLCFPLSNPFVIANGVMGFWFGAAHAAYGVYLYFSEQKGVA